MTIASPTQIENAVNNKEIQIIELTDTCTYDQFTVQQAKLLRDWVANGGVLWVNNDVLKGVFGIRYSRIRDFRLVRSQKTTAAEGTHPILQGVQEVYLTDLEGKSFALAYPGAIPLLAAKDVGYFFDFGYKEGDTLWSLVPYHKGWISNPKPIIEKEADGSVFWANFVKFCLREIPWPKTEPKTKTDGEDDGGNDGIGGPLTGIWRADTKEEFFLEDNGKKVKIRLASATPGFAEIIGSMERSDPKADPKKLEGLKLEGKLTVTFQGFLRPQTATVWAILEDENTMRWILPDWPIVKGTRVFRRAETRVFTRGGALLIVR
jgi:hypothetical protein